MESNTKFKAKLIIIVMISLLTFQQILMYKNKQITEIYAKNFYSCSKHLNNSKSMLEIIKNDYAHINNHYDKLYELSKELEFMDDCIQIIVVYDRYKLISNSKEEVLKTNTFPIEYIFDVYSDIIREWADSVSRNKLDNYPTLNDIKNMEREINNYFELFKITSEKEGKYLIRNIPIENLTKEYIFNSIVKIKNSSAFERIRKY